MRKIAVVLVFFLAAGWESGCSRKENNELPQATATQGGGGPVPGTPGASTQGPGKSTAPGDTTGPSAVQKAPNVLLLIADDLGVDVLKSSGVTKDPAITPNLDKLVASGLNFDNFWVTPACNTTRGALITGQHGFSSGIDFVPAVMADETATLQQRLKASDIKNAYATGIFGKWHLGGPQAQPGHPNGFGVDLYAGNLFNLENYNDWTLTTNQEQAQSTEYHTTKVVDLARDFISAQGTDKPWFAWVAFSAPHSPFHTPPASLITQTPNDTVPSQYKAMVESMDTEIGRLVDGLSPEVRANTLILFLGDNGTPAKARDRDVFERDHVKNSIYEGGIRAPLIVSGAGVLRRGEREAALVNATDIFATLVDLASSAANPSEVPKHSVSFAPLLAKAGNGRRTYNYAEWKSGGELYWAVRDAKHKAIMFPDGSTKLFETSDLSENSPLEDEATLNRLLDWGKKLRDGSVSPGGAGGEASLSSFCADHQGTTNHASMDVGRKVSLNGTVTITAKQDHCEITTNGIPNHSFNDGGTSFPHDVSEQSFQLQVPLAPKWNNTPTPLSLDTDNAILLSGAKVDMIAAACYNVEDGKTGCNDMSQPWRYDPVYSSNGFRVDRWMAHAQPTGAYHYHGVGKMAQANQVLGVAADGFAIHSALIEINGKPATMRSSYRLRSGVRTQSDASLPLPNGEYDGTYRDDWEYVEGHGDLDECNGATVNGQYMYFATEDFPYFMGCFRGTPDPSFKKKGPWMRYQHAHGPGTHVH